MNIRAKSVNIGHFSTNCKSICSQLTSTIRSRLVEFFSTNCKSEGSELTLKLSFCPFFSIINCKSVSSELTLKKTISECC